MVNSDEESRNSKARTAEVKGEEERERETS